MAGTPDANHITAKTDEKDISAQFRHWTPKIAITTTLAQEYLDMAPHNQSHGYMAPYPRTLLTKSLTTIL
jgi:hypothetical protein